MSFRIPAKKNTVVIGGPNSGKSTIARLISRFYKPFGGKILLDKCGLNWITESSLRKLIGYVGCETVMPAKTVHEFFKLIDPEVTEAAIEELLEENFDGLFKNLPDGLESCLVEPEC